MKFCFVLFVGLLFSKLDSATLQDLHKEDIRMASHLASHGYKVSNPHYPLLRVSEARSSTHSNSLLSLEDQRMVGHLRDEGWTVLN